MHRPSSPAAAGGLPALPPERIGDLFPFHLVLDRDLVLVGAGRSLTRLSAAAIVGRKFFDVFRIRAPEGVSSFDQIVEHQSRLFLIEQLTTGVVLRGQMMALAGSEVAAFMGAPGPMDSSTMTRLGLTFRDFALHDAIADFASVLQAQRMDNEDLHLLASRLTEQRAELQAVNGRLREQNEVLRETELQLRRQEGESRKLALIAARTDNAVILTDRQGRIEWVNDGFTRISGYTLDEVKGQKPGDILQGPETAPETVRYMGAQLNNGEGFSTEIINYSKQGRKYWLAIEVQPIHDERGEVVNFMAIERDITAAKEADRQLELGRDALRAAKEAAEAANEAKSQFLANMSHEIRTPLNAITGLSELLADTPLDERQRDYVDTLLKAARGLQGLVSDLLDLSKIEAGHLETVSERFDLWELVEDAVEQLAGAAYGKGLELACVIDSEVPRAVAGDGMRLRQVLLNLLGNAIRFTESGGACVRVSPVNGETERVRFEVQDTGVGIAPDDIARLFEPFTQVDETSTRRQGGTGLGLAISRQLVHLMGGRIGVESERGRGSKFDFDLPLPSAAPDSPLPSWRERQLRVGLHGLSPLRSVYVQDTLHGLGIQSVALLSDPADPAVREAVSAAGHLDLLVMDMVDPSTLLSAAAAWRRLEEARDARIVVLWPPTERLTRQMLPGRVTFLSLPLLPREILALFAPGATGRPESGIEEAAEEPARRGHVLVVEDNLANQKVARGFLAKLGWSADLVQSGEEALAAWSRARYDAILMDCQMPGMDGYATAREIRRREGNASRTPIIAITAYTRVDDRERCLAAGMDDYVAKPVRLNVLKEAIDRCVAAGRARLPGPAAPSLGAHTDIDVDLLVALCDLPGEEGGDLLGELIDIFAARSRELVTALAARAAAGDTVQVERIAHTLKGSALQLGAVAVARLCGRLEADARAGRMAAAEELLAAVDSSCGEAVTRLRAERQRLRPPASGGSNPRVSPPAPGVRAPAGDSSAG